MAFEKTSNLRLAPDRQLPEDEFDWSGDLTRLQESPPEPVLFGTGLQPIELEPDDHRKEQPGNPRKRGKAVVWIAAALAVVAIGVPAWWFGGDWLPKGGPPPAQSGRLVIETQPEGAVVFVDGVMRGVTPVDLGLSPGVHQVEVKTGDASRTLPVTITAGGTVTHHMEFQAAVPSFGALLVETEPAGATVSVDGQPRGTSPVVFDDLLPGEHTVRVQSEAGTVERTVVVSAGSRSSLFVPLVPRGVPVSGWLSVVSPVELQVFENGRLIGSSAADRLMMAAGRHQIELTNDLLAYRAVHQVNVRPGQVTPLDVRLPKGVLHINAVPWAEVWIDGTRAGETPLGNLSLTIGPHEVLFRHPQLGEQRHAVTVTLAAPARLSVDLNK